MVEVKSKQHLDQPSMELKESVLGKLNESFSLGGWYLEVSRNVLCSNIDCLSNLVHEEAHGSYKSIHPGYTKMYHNLRKCFGGNV